MELELPQLLAPDLPSTGFRAWVWVALIPDCGTMTAPHRHFLSRSPRRGMGDVSRLLRSLDMVAVSEASSPKSSPNPSLPVTAMGSQYLSI